MLRRPIRKYLMLFGSIILIFSALFLWAGTSSEKKTMRFPRIQFGQLAAPVGKLSFVERGTLPSEASHKPIYKVTPLKSKKALMVSLFKALPIESSVDIKSELDKISQAREPQVMSAGDSFDWQIGEWIVRIWQSGQYSVVKVKDPSSRIGEEPEPNIIGLTLLKYISS